MFLTFDDVGFTHAGSAQTIFSHLRLTLPTGWTGIVGPNGAGKTTLSRLAVGLSTPTLGRVTAPGRAILCDQRTDAAPDDLIRLIESDDPLARRVASRLGVAGDWAERWDTLSHGERKRAQLAAALAGDPTVLAVDEPTNHLDAEAREMVKDALQAFDGLGLLVSHDRALLDALCGRCLFLENGEVTLRPGGYTEGSAQAAVERETLERRAEETSRGLKRLRREYVERRERVDKGERDRSKRGIAAKDHDAKARVDAARVSDGKSGNSLRQLDGRLRRAETVAEMVVHRGFALGVVLPGERSGRRVDLALPPGELALGPERRLRHPALTLRPGERVALVGPNGGGKSTLIRRIVAVLEGGPVRVVHIPQEIDADRARAILEAFRSLPPDALGRAMTLVRRLNSDPGRLLAGGAPSPGEARKLLLAGAVERRPNLVILDEPTNHLDPGAAEQLEAALIGCAATILVVSHDRVFLERVTDRSWRIERVDSRLNEVIGE